MKKETVSHADLNHKVAVGGDMVIGSVEERRQLLLRIWEHPTPQRRVRIRVFLDEVLGDERCMSFLVTSPTIRSPASSIFVTPELNIGHAIKGLQGFCVTQNLPKNCERETTVPRVPERHNDVHVESRNAGLACVDAGLACVHGPGGGVRGGVVGGSRRGVADIIW